MTDSPTLLLLIRDDILRLEQQTTEHRRESAHEHHENRKSIESLAETVRRQNGRVQKLETRAETTEAVAAALSAQASTTAEVLKDKAHDVADALKERAEDVRVEFAANRASGDSRRIVMFSLLSSVVSGSAVATVAAALHFL
jgi:hypothetical protein